MVGMDEDSRPLTLEELTMQNLAFQSRYVLHLGLSFRYMKEADLVPI